MISNAQSKTLRLCVEAAWPHPTPSGAKNLLINMLLTITSLHQVKHTHIELFDKLQHIIKGVRTQSSTYPGKGSVLPRAWLPRPEGSMLLASLSRITAATASACWADCPRLRLGLLEVTGPRWSLPCGASCETKEAPLREAPCDAGIGLPIMCMLCMRWFWPRGSPKTLVPRAVGACVHWRFESASIVLDALRLVPQDLAH